MKVNGDAAEFTQSETLYDFLIRQNFDLRTIAVERNGHIMPKKTYHDVQLNNEDNLEIVRFVGGG